VSDLRHTLLLASAGTGKTFRLTSHFLGLLFRGVPPARILATTFTRKAAGEILDRVLERLLEATRDPKALDELNAALACKTVSAADCTAKLAELTRGIDQFRVRTLDAFFVHLAQLFALDLGLAPGWSILDEADNRQLEAEALSRALTEADRAEWLVLLRTLQMTPASRSVHEALASAVKIARSAFLDSAREAWDTFDPGLGFAEERVAEIRAALAAFQVPVTQKGEPNKNWEKAHRQALAHFDAENWKGLLELGLIKKLLAGEPFSRLPIDVDVFGPVAQHAQHRMLVALRARNAATRALLERFEVAYSRLKRARGGYRFEDLPAFLAPPGAHGEDPLLERQLDMWYRLDGRIDHLLLDEFQDTAPIQWRILRRIADEVLADGTGERSFFCVGDVKQSIYGWREAEPRLLAGMAERYPQLVPETIAKSWRSSRIVLETVNRVFRDIGANTALDGEQERAAATEWQRAFAEQDAAKPKPGATWFLQAEPKGEGENAVFPVLRMAAQRAAEIVREAPHCTVGILLRRGTYLARLIYLLRREGIFASGEGGNPLTDSMAVLHALSLLQFADHPDDKAAAFHVQTSPFAAQAGLQPITNPETEDAERRAAARTLRERLASEGYGPFLAGLLREFGASGYGEWDRKRFSQLVDLAFAWDGRAGLRPSAFADFVREERVEDPSSAQVKVMTIHRSKGLEFDAVILPELDLDPYNPRNEILTDRPEADGPITAVSRSASRALLASDPELERLAGIDVHRTVTEFLCLLYVAMTRAIHRLDLIAQDPARKTSAPTYARILRAAFGTDEPDEDGVLWRHAENDDPWWGSPKSERVESIAEPVVQDGLGLAPSTRLRETPRRAPSAQEGGTVRSGADVLAPRNRSAMTRGSLVHRTLAEVEWLEDFQATDAELLALGVELESDEGLRAEALAEVRTALGREHIAALLSRAGREGLEVWRERDFSLVLPDAGGGEHIWTGAFDRVVLAEDGAEIIDYKTDRIPAGGLAQRVEFYRPQLEGYRRVLAQLTGLDESRIRCRLAFLSSGEVVDL